MQTEIQNNQPIQKMDVQSILRTVFLGLITVFLGIVMIVVLYSAVAEKNRQQACQKFLDDTKTSRSMLSNGYDSLYSDYEDAAYNDSSIDRIAEQQLRAAEYTILDGVSTNEQLNYLIELQANCH